MRDRRQAALDGGGVNLDVQLAEALMDGQAERVDAWGDPECPMSAEDVLAKALALAQWGGVSAGLAQPLFGQVQALAEGGSLDALNAMLARVA